MATMLCRERKGEINRQICRNLCEPVRCAKVRIALYALSLTATCILSWLTRRPVHENYKEEVLRESLDIRLGSVSYSGTSCYAALQSGRRVLSLLYRQRVNSRLCTRRRDLYGASLTQPGPPVTHSAMPNFATRSAFV